MNSLKAAFNEAHGKRLTVVAVIVAQELECSPIETLNSSYIEEENDTREQSSRMQQQYWNAEK